jgi:hypothetical protein
MKDELTTILEAVGAAQAELAAYLTSEDRNAELAIAKLIGILTAATSSRQRDCCASPIAQPPRRQQR